MKYEKKPFGGELIVHTEPKHVYGYIESVDIDDVIKKSPFFNIAFGPRYTIGDIEKEFKKDFLIWIYPTVAIDVIEKEDPDGTWYIPDLLYPAFYLSKNRIWVIAPFIRQG